MGARRTERIKPRNPQLLSDLPEQAGGTEVGYLANVVEYWGPFLSGNLSSSIFGPSGSIPVEAGLSAWAYTKPGINIKVNGPDGLYNKFGVQVASSPDGPFVEKMANPTGLDWSTPNSGVLAIDEVGYRKEAAPGQLATWVRAAGIVNNSRYVDFEFGGRNTGNYAAYVLADRQFVQLAPVAGQAARGWYAGVTAMYAPPEYNRFSQYYELRLYGIGLLTSRPSDMVSVVVSRNVFSNYAVDAALQSGQLAHTGNFSITAAYYAPIAPGIRVGIGLGYTDHPTPVIYTPQTGSALNLLANLVTYW
jgi:porin